jgi:hypothetical protein
MLGKSGEKATFIAAEYLSIFRYFDIRNFDGGIVTTKRCDDGRKICLFYFRYYNAKDFVFLRFDLFGAVLWNLLKNLRFWAQRQSLTQAARQAEATAREPLAV